MSPTAFGRLLVRCVAALLALLVASAPALAQEDDGLMNEAGPFALPFTSRSLAMASKVLTLDKDQAASARELYQGYRSGYVDLTKKTRKSMNDLMQNAREDNDWPKVMKERAKLTQDYITQLRTLEKGLWDDLKALCTPAQAEKFGTAERARRRETGLLLSLGAGERIDLVQMLENLKIDRHSTPALDELVTRWETDLDKLLVEKDRVFYSNMKDMMSGIPDPEKMKKFVGELCSVCSRAGEASRRAAHEAEPLLPEAKRAAFAAMVKEKSYPRIYAPAHVDAAMKAAAEMKDLSAEQKTRIVELRESYAHDVGPVNDRWAAAAEEKQRQLPEHFMEMVGPQQKPEDPGDSFVAARKERRTLDEKYAARLKEVLSEDQRGRLPKDESKQSREIPEYLPDFEQDFKQASDQWKDDGK